VRLDRAGLIDLARFVLKNESVRRAAIEIAVVSDSEIARLNRKHLDHRGPTDVLSFDMGGGKELSGLIVVSADTARRRARELGHATQAELGLYLAHGLLHLLEYDDHRPGDRRKMHERQGELLAQFGMKLKG
jgi:probable rRNA maturation factor